jgi:hypothetical protein
MHIVAQICVVLRMCISFTFSVTFQDQPGSFVLLINISFTFFCGMTRNRPGSFWIICLDSPGSLVPLICVSFPLFCAIAWNRPGNIVLRMCNWFIFSVTYRISEFANSFVLLMCISFASFCAISQDLSFLCHFRTSLAVLCAVDMHFSPSPVPKSGYAWHYCATDLSFIRVFLCLVLG